jgi:hypothetical protein
MRTRGHLVALPTWESGMVRRERVHKIRRCLELISNCHLKLGTRTESPLHPLEICHVGRLFLNRNVAMSSNLPLSFQKVLECLHGVLEWLLEFKALEAPLMVNHFVEPDLLIEIPPNLDGSFSFVLKD